MNSVLYAPIPGLQIDRPEVPFAGGRLAKLPFDEWIALESEFEYEDHKYKKVEPVFWISDLRSDNAPPQEALVNTANDAVWPVHCFLLDERAPLDPASRGPRCAQGAGPTRYRYGPCSGIPGKIRQAMRSWSMSRRP